MRIRITHVEPASLARFAPALRRLEGGIAYPIGDTDHFTIDHGADYFPFFQSMGAAHFLVAHVGAERAARVGDDVAGSIAGVLKDVRVGERRVRSLYICDLKVAPAQRGQGVARRLCLQGLLEIARTGPARASRFLFGVAMQGARGDVMRSARGAHPLRLGRALARCAVFFAPVEALRALDPRTCPSLPAGAWLDLSPDAQATTSTAGKKDLVLASTGAPWPLMHLSAGPRAWTPSWGAYLQTCARALPDGTRACFALDARLSTLISWLDNAGVRADASCSVYGIGFVGRPAFVHVATSEV
jgi:hypothetical protein